MKIKDLILVLQQYDPNLDVEVDKVIDYISGTAPMPLTENDIATNNTTLLILTQGF